MRSIDAPGRKNVALSHMIVPSLLYIAIVVPPGLRPIAADIHIAPPAAPITALIEVKPMAIRTNLDSLQSCGFE